MGGPAFDLLANPLGAVRVLFDREVHRLRSAAQIGGQGGGDGGAAQEAMKRQLAEGDWGVRTLVDEFLFRDGNIDKVPEINSVGVDHVPVGSLVRFRGMVQDMWGTEFYQGLYKRSRQPPSASPSGSSAPPSPPWRTTKYTDGDCGGGMGGDGAEGLGEGAADFGSIWERRLLYCVPVPGEQPWARALRDGGREGRGNRGRGEGGSGGEEGGGAEKRGREEGDAELMGMDVETRVAPSEAGESKRQATTAVANTTAAAIPTSSSNTMAQLGSTGAAGDAPPFVDLHFPLGPSASASHGPPLLPCIVKLYDSVESQVKLNQVVEFVGVVAPPSAPTVHTAHTAAAAPQDAATGAGAGTGGSTGAAMEVEMMGGDMGMGACPSACLPSSQVLRLHCLTWRKLPHLFSTDVGPTVAAAGSIRAALLSRLAAALGGDRLAAEYLLLHLLSRVHTRIEPMPLGKLSLNLSGFPEPSLASTPSPTPPPLSSSPPSLSQAASPSLSALTSSLQTLLPATHTLPLSLDNLNSRRLTPHKDYTSDRLVSGVLQLPAGTHLTIDETALKPGRVAALGSQNLQALKELLEWQKVDYDFQYYKMEMQSDIPVLILSHATSRLLPADVSLPVRCTAPPQPVREDEPEVATWRRYIGCCRLLDHEIKEDMREPQQPIFTTSSHPPQIPPSPHPTLPTTHPPHIPPSPQPTLPTSHPPHNPPSPHPTLPTSHPRHISPLQIPPSPHFTSPNPTLATFHLSKSHPRHISPLQIPPSPHPTLPTYHLCGQQVERELVAARQGDPSLDSDTFHRYALPGACDASCCAMPVAGHFLEFAAARGSTAAGPLSRLRHFSQFCACGSPCGLGGAACHPDNGSRGWSLHGSAYSLGVYPGG
ncbi:unnamed protein product [Closterium sp. NIES-64]|nr:unnamed protein product [Closterium sp. NIES-64]